MEGLDLNALPHGDEIDSRIPATGIELMRWNTTTGLQVDVLITAG